MKKGEVHVGGMAVRLLPSSSNGDYVWDAKGFGFELVYPTKSNGRRNMILVARTMKEAQSWVRAIRVAAVIEPDLDAEMMVRRSVHTDSLAYDLGFIDESKELKAEHKNKTKTIKLSKQRNGIRKRTSNESTTPNSPVSGSISSDSRNSEDIQKNQPNPNIKSEDIQKNQQTSLPDLPTTKAELVKAIFHSWLHAAYEISPQMWLWWIPIVIVFCFPYDLHSPMLLLLVYVMLASKTEKWIIATVKFKIFLREVTMIVRKKIS